MVINFDTFKKLWDEAKSYSYVDRYIMERGWEDWMEQIQGADEIAELLKKIYSLSRGGIYEVIKQFKNMRVMSTQLGIPYGTIQNWKLGDSDPPEYLVMMIAYTTIN